MIAIVITSSSDVQMIPQRYFTFMNILNKEIYGMKFGVNDLKRRYLLTMCQKLSLEQNLKQILPLYFMEHPVPDGETRLESGNLNSSKFSHGNENMKIDTKISGPQQFYLFILLVLKIFCRIKLTNIVLTRYTYSFFFF